MSVSVPVVGAMAKITTRLGAHWPASGVIGRITFISKENGGYCQIEVGEPVLGKNKFSFYDDEFELIETEVQNEWQDKYELI